MSSFFLIYVSEVQSREGPFSRWLSSFLFWIIENPAASFGYTFFECLVCANGKFYLRKERNVLNNYIWLM
jgi:hypothetical protein